MFIVITLKFLLIWSYTLILHSDKIIFIFDFKFFQIDLYKMSTLKKRKRKDCKVERGSFDLMASLYYTKINSPMSYPFTGLTSID